MMDIERNVSVQAAKAPAKMSFMRKWGPALLAIVGVFALNGSLLGPSGSKIPELSEAQLNRRSLIEARTNEVLAMAPSEDDHRMLKYGFGSRDLSEEEGGVMEYTRRRHRYLGEYVHVDVSDQFTVFGKWSVAVIYFAYWFFLMFPNWFLPIGRPGIALGGGLSMVVWRYLLLKTGHGPFFDAGGVIIM